MNIRPKDPRLARQENIPHTESVPNTQRVMVQDPRLATMPPVIESSSTMPAAPAAPSRIVPQNPRIEAEKIGLIKPQTLLPDPVERDAATSSPVIGGGEGVGLNYQPETEILKLPPPPIMAKDPRIEAERLGLNKPRTAADIETEIGNLRNRPHDNKWGILDTLKGAAIGALKGYGSTGSIGGALGGAGAGAAIGTFHPDYDESFMADNKLAKLQTEQTAARSQEEFAAKQRKANEEAIKARFESEGARLANIKTVGQIGQQEVDIINSKVKPLLETFTADKKVDEKEAAILSKYTGLPFSATQWQEYIDREVNGKTFTRSQYEPVFAENKTVPINPTEVPRNIQIGNGSPLPLTPKQAAPIIAANEQNNANRADNAYRFEQTEKRLSEQFSQSQALEIQKYNFNEYGKYQGNIEQFGKDKLNAQRAIAENQPTVVAYTAQMAKDQAALDAMSDEEKTVYGDKLRTSIAASQGKIVEAQGKIDGANYFINNAVAPTAPSQLATPKTSSGATVSQKKVMKYAKKKGIAYEEAKKHAEDDGFTVQ